MIPFSPPRIDKKIIDAVVDTLQSGWITTGPKTKEFEKELAAYSGAKKVLCLSSGSAGLELILRWFGIKEGDEVIVPAYTYAASANVIHHCGAKIIFVDSSTADLNVDIAKIREKISKRTQVIIPVDIAGWPCDYDEINALVREKGIRSLFQAESKEQEQLGRILVLSDAAHSLGAIYKGKKTGSLTDISVYSFHAVKNLTTAEGGAICLNLPDFFNHEELYKSLNIKSLHGQSKDALEKMQIGNWQYDIVEAGYKCNMTDIQAAMGLVELERYDRDMLVKRKSVFDFYSLHFSACDWALCPEYENEIKTSSYHVYTLKIKGIGESKRNEIMQKIFAKGVAVNVHFIPLPMMSFYAALGNSIKDYPMAYHNYEQLISLPVYYDLTNEQLKTIVEVVKNAVETSLYSE